MNTMALFLICVLQLFNTAKTYENIALHKPAWQQHTAIGMGADRAVDGLYSNLSGLGGQCALSGFGQTTAEWRVDLGEIHSIRHIFIQYLTQNDIWDENNRFTSDFLGFSLYISNTIRKEDGILCFKDTIYTMETIPNPLNISCRVSGRYVIYYNNRTHLPFPKGYSDYAVFTLCEIEVYAPLPSMSEPLVPDTEASAGCLQKADSTLPANASTAPLEISLDSLQDKQAKPSKRAEKKGCSNISYFGDNCSTPCHQNCFGGRCDVVDGTCLGCVPGYTGSTCDTECTNRTYGLQCNQSCGLCRNEERCHHVNGSCINGCDKGKQGAKCEIDCLKGYYGYDCQNKCSQYCKDPEDCNILSGQCEGGCRVGWKMPKCDEECNEGRYGLNCSQLCGHCKEKTQCHHISGFCAVGCDSGYWGTRCTQKCDGGTFGPGCIKSCGKCAQNKQCHHVNGSCVNGCDPGYHESQCTKVCETGKYGIDCRQRCSAFCHNSGICHHLTGTCKDGCKNGWKGAQCLEVQNNGNTYTTMYMYVVIAALSASVTINIIQVMFVIILRKENKKQKKSKAYKQNREGNVFTQDINGYDSVISRPDDNYQELTTITADR